MLINKKFQSVLLALWCLDYMVYVFINVLIYLFVNLVLFSKVKPLKIMAAVESAALRHQFQPSRRCGRSKFGPKVLDTPGT